MSTTVMASPLFSTLFFFFFITSQTSCSPSSSPSSSDNAGNSSYPVLLRACGTNRTQNPQSFDINFVDTMEIISQKVAESGFGFASSLSDNSTNRVFGLGQCFNYLSSIDCRLCYAESRVQLPLCLPSTTARVYLDGCFLSYQDRDFSQEILDDADKLICGSSRNLSNLMRFGELATGLIQNLTSMASEQKDYYMQGKVLVRSDVEVYGIAQCWRSLNRSGCKECLENARKNVVGCLPGPDGRALNAGCYVRYSTEPFFLRLSQLKSNSSARRRLAIALGSIFAAVVVIGGAILWRSRGSSCRTDDMEGSSEILRSITESQLSFKYSDLRKATNNFSLDSKIGQGGYGSVYKGILSDGREIAVKRLFVNTNQWLDQFFNEVNLISRVQHKNLVKLFGCSVDGPESLLVYEYLSNTSLDNFLFDSLRKNVLDWQRRFEIIVGTAEGLAYLHDSSEIRIIHRDIKASNILLDKRYKPKISDFGLARGFTEDQSHLSTGLAGTLGYMAPEYAVHGQLTEKADVYSYGILVLEVISGCKNTRSMPTSSENHSLVSKTWEHFSSKTLIEMLDPHLQGQCLEEQVVKVLTIGLLCTQASPTLRPPMWKVVEMLSSSTGDLPIPTQPPYINIKGVDFSSDGSRTSYMFSSSSKSPVSVNGISLSVMRGR